LEAGARVVRIAPIAQHRTAFLCADRNIEYTVYLKPFANVVIVRQIGRIDKCAAWGMIEEDVDTAGGEEGRRAKEDIVAKGGSRANPHRVADKEGDERVTVFTVEADFA